MFPYSKGVIDIQNNSRVKAIAYADGAVTLGGDTYVTGAVTAGGNITLGNDTSIFYSSSAMSGTQFGSFCEKSISHFDINVGSGSGSTCLPHSVTVTARTRLGRW